GVEPAEFESKPLEPVFLRKQLVVDPTIFLFGFFGRFMPQKGFDLLIDSVDCIRSQCNDFRFAIVAVGSGDYIREYKEKIKKKGLGDYFYFLPFRPMVHHLYPQVDVIVMPSRWEASGLLAMETLCMGTPLIASDCIGLRETVDGTPAFVFPFGRSEKLAEMMCNCMQDRGQAVFQAFRTKARQRFHVASAAEKLVKCIEQVVGQG
ncbi:MAG: glycosyltransferase family 4 protein, partial [Chlorobium sp.]|nr:glycosyltransferase family 4 protein [Chlorobium sp.]